MKISIITVCFNARDTIEETFLSVTNQSYKNVELIVIDGGSTDGTLEIINKYKDKISYFVSEPDDGIYDAMNKGIKTASGDFIIFLNANDVFYDENVLQKVSDALNENPEVKFLFGDTDCISEDKKSSQIMTYEKMKNKFSIMCDNICHQSIFYHRSLFKKFGIYSDEFKIYADWDFNVKCLVQNNVASIYLPIVISKFQLGGLCSTVWIRKVCQKEKKALVKKYYYEYSFLVSGNNFLKNNFGISYKWLTNSSLCKKGLNLFVSQEKYKLNIKKVSP